MAPRQKPGHNRKNGRSTKAMAESRLNSSPASRSAAAGSGIAMLRDFCLMPTWHNLLCQFLALLWQIYSRCVLA